MRSERKLGYGIGTRIPSLRPQAWVPATLSPLASTSFLVRGLRRVTYAHARQQRGLTRPSFPILMFSSPRCRKGVHRSHDALQEYHNMMNYDRSEGNEHMCEPHIRTEAKYDELSQKEGPRKPNRNETGFMYPEPKQTIQSRAAYSYRRSNRRVIEK